MPAAPSSPSRTVTWTRLRHPMAVVALLALLVYGVGQALGSVVAGRIAQEPSAGLLLALAICFVGGALVEAVGRIGWASVVDRALGRLREDLLDAALAQPLDVLAEQAVGEVLDRVDDDTHDVGTLARLQLWTALRAAFTGVSLWVVAALTWWPAWVLFPLICALTWWALRPLLGAIARRKVIEEVAWTDHAAALEEGIASRDDVRTSLGQAFTVERLAQRSKEVHRRFFDVLTVEAAVVRRAMLILHSLLLAVAVTGAALASAGTLSIAELVTLFLVTTGFVSIASQVAEQLPDLQAGVGAIVRIRQLLDVEPEPTRGRAVPPGPVDLAFVDLSFAYPEGGFALEGIDLRVPAGSTLALVGRTGSGKSTLASLVSRAVDPRPGSVLLGGVDVLELDLQALRSTVGVVTQRTEILAATLAENITLFADHPRAEIEQAVADLGLTAWVEGLPDGLDTRLGPGGARLSAGEEQLIAFARLLLRDVQVVVLDEATARMDPVTEARVVAAADRLLAERTGILVAHRLSTIARADLVAVLQRGRLIQHGTQAELSGQEGSYRDLLRSADQVRVEEAVGTKGEGTKGEGAKGESAHPAHPTVVGGGRRRTAVPVRPETGDGPSLARGVWQAVMHVRRPWGLYAVGLFLLFALTGSTGAFTGLAWGRTVESLRAGHLDPTWLLAAAASMLLAPFVIAEGIRRYPRWWAEVLLRVRMSVLIGQTDTRRLDPTPPGEIVARALDADRYARYADRWVDVVNGLLIVLITAVVAGTPLAGLVLLVVLVVAASASALGRPIAGRAAAAGSATRADFGRALVSTLESVRTVKLAGRVPQLRAHLRRVDAGRVQAAVREHRVEALLQAVPTTMVQVGVVAAWAALLAGWWGLAIALLVANAVSGFDWFGRVAGAVVTEAPGTRDWQRRTARMAGGVDLLQLPPGVDLVTGEAPAPARPSRVPLSTLTLEGFGAVHEDGTIGLDGVDLTLRRGELVLLLGPVGSGKSSLLRALAGLTEHAGQMRWNDVDVTDPEVFLRPGQVAYVAQVPRVLSGSFADNVRLGHDRAFDAPVEDARLGQDVGAAGGPEALIGHRGVRLSGGQVQRVALARALATDAELLLADDISSALDATTEIELWESLRRRGVTVLGATSKRAALARADRVVVLEEGQVRAIGPWSELSREHAHLAG